MDVALRLLSRLVPVPAGHGLADVLQQQYNLPHQLFSPRHSMLSGFCVRFDNFVAQNIRRVYYTSPFVTELLLAASPLSYSQAYPQGAARPSLSSFSREQFSRFSSGNPAALLPTLRVVSAGICLFEKLNSDFSSLTDYALTQSAVRTLLPVLATPDSGAGSSRVVYVSRAFASSLLEKGRMAVRSMGSQLQARMGAMTAGWLVVVIDLHLDGAHTKPAKHVSTTAAPLAFVCRLTQGCLSLCVPQSEVWRIKYVLGG